MDMEGNYHGPSYGNIPQFPWRQTMKIVNRDSQLASQPHSQWAPPEYRSDVLPFATCYFVSFLLFGRNS